MPFHLAGWGESVLTAGTVQEIAAVEDDILFSEGNDLRVPSDLPRLIGYVAYGDATSIARFEAPSLRAFLNQAVAEAQGSRVRNPADSFRGLFADPLPLVPGESVKFLSDGGGDGVTAADVVAMALWADGAPQPVTGDIRTVRSTVVVPTGTAFQWRSATPIFDEDLPGGRFQLVGASTPSDFTAIRFILAGQSNRPGGYGRGPLGVLSTGIQVIEIPGQRRGGWGVWGEFDVNRPPVVEAFAEGTGGATIDVFMDLIMLG